VVRSILLPEHQRDLRPDWLADLDELQVGFIPVDELSQSIEHFICRPVIDPFT